MSKQEIVIGNTYRIRRGDDGLMITVLDYHAGPLWLTEAALAELGFTKTTTTDKEEDDD